MRRSGHEAFRAPRPGTLDGTALTAYDGAMLGSSGPSVSVQPKEAELQLARRRVLVRCCILFALVLAYRGLFSVLHGLIGSPAYLLCLGICLLAAARLGVRGALVAIVTNAVIDRALSHQLPVRHQTRKTTGIMSLILKLVQ